MRDRQTWVASCHQEHPPSLSNWLLEVTPVTETCNKVTLEVSDHFKLTSLNV